MSRITLITPYFWPEVTASVPLMTSLAEDLVADGHEVVVVTSLPSRNLDARSREAFRRHRTSQETYGGARIIRYPNPFASRKGSLAKVLEGFVFTIWAMYSAIRLRAVTDVFYVYSNPPLLSLPVSFCAGRIPIIYNLQDLFPDSAIADGIIREGAFARLLRYLERKSYERSALITVIGQSFSEHVAMMAPITRTAVVPNWVDTDKIDRVQRDRNSLSTSLNLRDEFVVLYAGNMGFAQNLNLVVDAAEILKDHPGIRFILVGDGQHRDAIRDKIRGLGLSNVTMLPMQPQELVPQVYSLGDVGIVTVRSGRERSSIPSKTWTIMSCRSTVVACVGENSELGNLISSQEIGVVVPPDDAQGLAQAIVMLYEDRSLRTYLGERGRSYVERHLSRKAITSMYNRMVSDLVCGASSTDPPSSTLGLPS